MRTQIAIPWIKLIFTLIVFLAMLLSGWYFMEHSSIVYALGTGLLLVLLVTYLVRLSRLRGNERYSFIEASFYRSLYLLIGLGVLLLWETWTV